jgi:hypothetical protein
VNGAPLAHGKNALRVALCTVPLFASNPAGKNLFKQKKLTVHKGFFLANRQSNFLRPCSPSAPFQLLTCWR